MDKKELQDILVANVRLKVNYTVIAPERPTIIFLHDSLGCITLWRDFPCKLGEAANCNILVYDRQGYGISQPLNTVERDNDYLEKEAEVLNGLVEEMGLKEVILFGHSDGASIALIAAAKFPSHIKGVIVEGAHIFVEDITLEGIRAAKVAYETTSLKQKLEKYHGDKTNDVVRAWTDTWLSDNFRTWNIERLLPGINCPVLVFQGAEDEFGSMEQVEGIINRVSGPAEKVVIPAIGHSPHKEAPDEVLRHSASFIKSFT